MTNEKIDLIENDIVELLTVLKVEKTKKIKIFQKKSHPTFARVKDDSGSNAVQQEDATLADIIYIINGRLLRFVSQINGKIEKQSSINEFFLKITENFAFYVMHNFPYL